MLRTRLDEGILQINILQLGRTKPFLERVMDPPDPRAVELSIKVCYIMKHVMELISNDLTIFSMCFYSFTPEVQAASAIVLWFMSLLGHLLC
jgi:hypothetical protein